ncbi:MAG: hypothetical protein K6G55_00565 [Selenomonadaceae bacterium]|nr:hypothetical protein [Selenomonadaceae bacterium]
MSNVLRQKKVIENLTAAVKFYLREFIFYRQDIGLIAQKIKLKRIREESD